MAGGREREGEGEREGGREREGRKQRKWWESYCKFRRIIYTVHTGYRAAADVRRSRAWWWVRGLVERRTHCTTNSILNTLSGIRAGGGREMSNKIVLPTVTHLVPPQCRLQSAGHR